MGRKKTPIKKRRCIINGKNINIEKNLCIVRVYADYATTDPSLIFSS
jgi:hypothetical protein